MLQRCLDNQQPVIEKLNSKVNAAMQRSGQTKSPIFSKLCELNDVYKQVQCLAQQRRNDLLDKLQQVSCTNVNFRYLWYINNDCDQWSSFLRKKRRPLAVVCGQLRSTTASVVPTTE